LTAGISVDWSSKEVLLTLRLVHIISAAVLVGSVFFNYFILRPALARIPPPQQGIVSAAIGNFFVYLAWITLALLIASGLLRLQAMGILSLLGNASFWSSGYGRWLAVMIGGWFVATLDAALLTFIARPLLLRRFPLMPHPVATAVQGRRETQVWVGRWVERLVLLNLIATVVAMIAGASLQFGGLI
jgi:hypothetical protein